MQWIKSGSPPCIQLPHEGLGALDQIWLFPCIQHRMGRVWGHWSRPGSPPASSFLIRRVWVQWSGSGSLSASSFPMRRV